MHLPTLLTALDTRPPTIYIYIYIYIENNLYAVYDCIEDVLSA